MGSSEFLYRGRAVDLQLGHRPALDVAVLAADVWGYVEQFILQQGADNARHARAFWQQAERFGASLANERPEASPLHLYYMMLNAVKALLVLRKGHGTVSATKSHGARYDAAGLKELKSKQKRSEQPLPGMLIADGQGTLGLLASAMGDSIGKSANYSLETLLSSVVAVHRAYCTLRESHQDRFLSIEKNVRLVRVADECRFEAQVAPGYDLTRCKAAIPVSFEVCESLESGPLVVGFKERISLSSVADPSSFAAYHTKVRRHFDVIAGHGRPKFYLRRADRLQADLAQITLNFSIALSLSSLARYYPQHLQVVFDRPDGWLLKEYLRTAPAQFLALIAGEITGRIIQRPYSDLR